MIVTRYNGPKYVYEYNELGVVVRRCTPSELAALEKTPEKPKLSKIDREYEEVQRYWEKEADY